MARWWWLALVVGCDREDDGPPRACVGPGPVCEGICPIFEERLEVVRDTWDRRDIDGYVAYRCGEYRVISRFADKGQTDNYFIESDVMVATALRNGPTAQWGLGCLDHVRWQGAPVSCTPECALEYSRRPETLVGIPPCDDPCQLPAPVCDGLCPTLDERKATVDAQLQRGDIDAWFISQCGSTQRVLTRIDGPTDRVDNHFDPMGTMLSTHLIGTEHADECPTNQAWQGPVQDCTLTCAEEYSRDPRPVLNIEPCRCQRPAPVCRGLCPTFAEQATTAQADFERGALDGHATWRCGDLRVVSRFSDAGRKDHYYQGDETLVANALYGDHPDYAQLCSAGVAWEGEPVDCVPSCALTSSRNPMTLLGIPPCAPPDGGAVDASVDAGAAADAGP